MQNLEKIRFVIQVCKSSDIKLFKSQSGHFLNIKFQTCQNIENTFLSKSKQNSRKMHLKDF